MIFETGQRIVFIGDSVTDCGRRAGAAPYGEGYMNLVRTLVEAAHPELGLIWFNRGIAGDTTRHLRERWDEDAIALRPDWLSVMVGINDVWRSYDGRPEDAVPLDGYRTNLRALLAGAVEATGCRLILAEPYLIEPDRTEPQRAQSDRYVAVARELAVEFDALLIRTQDAFDRVLAHRPPSHWSPDRVHPNAAGHAVIAGAYLSAVGWQPPV